MRALLLKMRNLLTGTSKRTDHVWPCLKHDHITRNCATCQALIEMTLS
jgi:5-methylcytosine-specific restriction endonuclease McrA